MKALNFINTHKRIVIAVMVAIFIVLLIFPIGTVVVESGNTQSEINLTAYNISSKIEAVKKAYSVDNISIKDIDRNSPTDDAQRTLIAVHDTVKNLDFAVAMIVFTFVLVILGGMVTYVKPNSVFGIVLFCGGIITLILASAFGIEAINIFNTNVELIKTFYGVDSSFKGMILSTNGYYFFLIAFSGLIMLADVALRKPKEQSNESEKLTKAILFLCAIISVLMVLFITAFLFIKGVPTISKIGQNNFLFSSDWNPKPPDNSTPHFGILNMILTSFAGTFGAILIGVPVGILVAVFISQLIPQRAGKVLLETTNLLAGIPSVIYGAVGAILLVPFIQRTFTFLTTGKILLTAILVLSVMVLPTIISVTTTSLNAVPGTYMEASLALGLTKEASVFRVLIPAARSGIMTGVMLGLGRAIGEAMAIILVSGNGTGFPNLFKSARFLTTGIVAEMGYAEGLHRDALFAIGLVLFVFILIINSIFRIVIKKAGEKYEQC